MICPNCKNEMEKGHLSFIGKLGTFLNYLYWRKTKLKLFEINDDNNEVRIAKIPYIKPSIKNVYICKNCQIISYKYA